MVRKKKKYAKASFTIEAACVMSPILFVIVGTMYLCFFVHNQAWLTAAAYEAALAGSLEGVREDGKISETAEMRSRELGNTGFFGAENLSVHVEAGKSVEVSYSADTVSGFGGLSWKLKAEGASKVIRPVEWIRKVKSLADIADSVQNGS